MLLLRCYKSCYSQSTKFDGKVGQFGIKRQANEHLFSVSARLLIYGFGGGK